MLQKRCCSSQNPPALFRGGRRYIHSSCTLTDIYVHKSRGWFVGVLFSYCSLLLRVQRQNQT